MIKVKLWLDDIRPAPDNTWTVAKTAKEAMDILSMEDVDVADLDHDLGICDSCLGSNGMDRPDCPCSMTGYDVVKFMAENNIWPKHGTYVHSMNPVGRQNMLEVIKRYSGEYSLYDKLLRYTADLKKESDGDGQG